MTRSSREESTGAPRSAVNSPKLNNSIFLSGKSHLMQQNIPTEYSAGLVNPGLSKDQVNEKISRNTTCISCESFVLF